MFLLTRALEKNAMKKQPGLLKVCLDGNRVEGMGNVSGCW